MNRPIKQRHQAWSDIVLPEEQLADLKKQAAMFLTNHPARPQGTLLKGAPGTGKTLLARTLATAMGINFLKVTLADLKIPSLGASGQRVRELWTEARAGKLLRPARNPMVYKSIRQKYQQPARQVITLCA